jgi:hypothetical protein
MVFWAIFMLPAQGFFNSLIYFYSPMKQPRRSAVQSSLSRKRSSATNVPVLPPALFQDKESQELGEDEPVVESQIITNAITEGSLAGYQENLEVEVLSTKPEASMQQ